MSKIRAIMGRVDHSAAEYTEIQTMLIKEGIIETSKAIIRSKLLEAKSNLGLFELSNSKRMLLAMLSVLDSNKFYHRMKLLKLNRWIKLDGFTLIESLQWFRDCANLSVVAANGFFGNFDKEYADPWLGVSKLFKMISEEQPNQVLTAIVFTSIGVLLPIILGAALSFLLFAKKYFDVFKQVIRRRIYISSFLMNMLDEKLAFVSHIASNIDRGVPMDQQEIGQILGRVLKTSSKSNFYATTLMEPDKIFADPDHIGTIETTIRIAKDLE
ncbi:MAG: hypothetical protein IPN95_27965 [Bacteroidetes bacterium]|nr:hypothetical protein [Bacteroidota bacterium]